MDYGHEEVQMKWGRDPRVYEIKSTVRTTVFIHFLTEFVNFFHPNFITDGFIFIQILLILGFFKVFLFFTDLINLFTNLILSDLIDYVTDI